jgi:hypothetical protein
MDNAPKDELEDGLTASVRDAALKRALAKPHKPQSEKPRKKPNKNQKHRSSD